MIKNLLLCLSVFLSLVLAGCTREQASTPQEQEEQETRMRDLLIESSPRNMNDIPKAVPEFKRDYDLNHYAKQKESSKESLETEQPIKDRPTAAGEDW